MDFLTPEFFDLLVIIVIVLGLALAGIRLYDDLTRPLPAERSTSADTEPRKPQNWIEPNNDSADS
jgi:hypothetical protein